MASRRESNFDWHEEVDTQSLNLKEYRSHSNMEKHNRTGLPASYAT